MMFTNLMVQKSIKNIHIKLTKDLKPEKYKTVEK